MSSTPASITHPLPDFPRGIWRISPWWVRDEKQAVRQSLLIVIEVAHRRGLNPVPLVHALADEHRGWYRQRLLRLAFRMHEGSNLVQALEQTPGLLSQQQVLSLRLGLQSGILAEVLRRESRSEPIDAQETWTSAYRSIIYFILLIIFGSFIIGFLLLYVVPMFKELTEEFSGVNDASESFHTIEMLGTWGPVVVPNVLIGVLLIWIASSYFGLGAFIESRSWFGRLRNVSKLHGAGVLKLLSMAMQYGRPLDGAVSTLARYHFSPPTRAKLLQVSNEMQHGENIWSSMQSAGILNARESSALSVAASGDQRAWIAERLAEKRLMKVSARTKFYVYLIYPLLVLSAGAIVLSVAAMAFGFLRDLIVVTL